jgi:hypothetical protein
MNLEIPRKTLNITQIHSGGFSPMDVVYKIGLNNVNMNTYQIKSLDEQFIFRFTSKNKKETEKNKYLGAGGLTAVYSIKLKSYKNDKYAKSLEKYKDKFILRIFDGAKNLKPKSDVEIGNVDTSNDEQSKFINMWTRHKQMFPENIIDIFLYGDILINNEYLGYYSITRMYGDDKVVKNLSFVERMKYLRNLYSFLIKLKENDLTYRDMKIENVGIDLETSSFIVIDYDDVTLLKPSEVKYLADNQFLHYSFGTYAPIYFLENIKNNNFDMNFDLIYLYGLFNIIQYMFKKDDFDGNDDYNIFIFLKYFDNIWEPIYNFVSCVFKNKSIPTECEGLQKSINIQYNKCTDDIKFLKENIVIIDKYGFDSTFYKILFDLLIYILYPLCVDTYEEASAYSKIDNYNKIIKIIDILLEKYNKKNKNYRQKYLKYKTKYMKLKKIDF